MESDDASDDAPDLHIGRRTAQQCGKNKEMDQPVPNAHAGIPLVVIQRKPKSTYYGGKGA
jgi:hypothetical protein